MTTSAENWPFDHWHQIAIRRFNLQPNAFWEMPLRDWLALMNGIKRPGFDRASLTELLKLYPDTGGENE